MEKSKRGIRLSTTLLNCLFDELIAVFSKHHDVDIKTLKVFQLFGFGKYDEDQPNLRAFIHQSTGESINGKYLYNKIKQQENNPSKTIHITRDYLSILIKAINYQSYRDFIQKSPYVTEEIRHHEENLLSNNIDYGNVLYYVGYYVEDKNYFIKSKLSIYQGKTADWDIRYWETDNKPSFYSYTGKVVTNGDSALSFYFPKENSNIKKECFVNVFSGNNMRIKPLLLGSYCGFGRNNNPVVGKIVFERVNSLEEQEKQVLSQEINPIFYQILYSKRISVQGLLPHELNELKPVPNFYDIIKYLMGSYYGFFLEKNRSFVPVLFKVIDQAGNVEFEINSRKYLGIGRLSPHEHYLNVEFEDEEDNLNCNFSFQVKPIGDQVFSSHILVNIGTLIFSGQVILWKDNLQIKEIIEKTPKFSLDLLDLDNTLSDKISEHISLGDENQRALFSNTDAYLIPKSLTGDYLIELDTEQGPEKWKLSLDQEFVIETSESKLRGMALFMNGNICLLTQALNDINVLGLYIIFVGNTSKKQIIKKRGVYAGYDAMNKPVSTHVVLNSIL